MERILQALTTTAQNQEQTLHQIGESQKQMADILSLRALKMDDSAKSSQFSNLTTRLSKFVHDPTRGKTFTLWFERHKSTFAEGAKGLTETESKELLLYALGDKEYQQLLSRLSPKKPYEMSFEDLVRHLKKQFHDNKTLFQRRFEALNFRASLPTAIEILDKVNVLGDAFELNNFNIDQLKILLTALALSDHTYYTERTVLFKVASEKEAQQLNSLEVMLSERKGGM